VSDDHKEAARSIVEQGSTDTAFQAQFKQDPVAVLHAAGIPVEGEHKNAVADYLRGEIDQGWFPTSKCSWCKIGMATVGAAIVGALTVSGVAEGAEVAEAAEAGAEEEGVSVTEWIEQHWGNAVERLGRVVGGRRKAAALLAGMGSLSVGAMIHAICHAIGDC